MLEPATSTCVLGRYALHGEVASGGMATVHYGQLLGGAGFSKVVAIKRLRPQYANDPEFSAMFLDEARLAARIRHPNVVSTLDVAAFEGELFLVLEYVHGDSLSRLVSAVRQAGKSVPPRIATAILAGVLHGLHAAHEATSQRGEPLNVVHRDVSPQNILVGADGVARVLDFGVAKAAGRVNTTRDGQLKGKLGYMSPEQLMGNVSRATDVFAASVVLWEVLAGRRLFSADSEGEVVQRILAAHIDPPSRYAPAVPPELDALTLRGLERSPKERFATASDMARALESALPAASASDVADFVEHWARASLEDRARQIAAIESPSLRMKASEPKREPVAANDADTERVAVSPTSTQTEASGLRSTAAGEPETQLSASAHLGPPAGLATTANRWRAVLLGSAVVAAAGVVLAAGVRLGEHRATGGEAAAAASASGAPTSSSEQAASAVSIVLPPASASASTPAAASVSVPGRARTIRPAAPAQPRVTPAGCSPPYAIGADGLRHYKRECAP